MNGGLSPTDASTIATRSVTPVFFAPFSPAFMRGSSSRSIPFSAYEA